MSKNPNSLCGYANPMQFDMALQEPAFAMLQKGIRVDLEKRKQIADEYEQKLSELYPNLIKVAGNLKAKKSISDDRIKKWLYDTLKIPPRTREGKRRSDEDALRAIMADSVEQIKKAKTFETRYRWQIAYIGINLILKIKRIEKDRMYVEEALDDDNRARCTETVGGAQTGRWAHSSTPWDTGNNRATVPLDLRVIYIPDDGMELAEFDLNRGESWVYSFLSLDPELMRIHTTFGDFHSETASVISTVFGDKHYTVDEIRKLYKAATGYHDFGYIIRYLGKKVNHASAYRMGPFRGAEIINAEADDTGITITPSQMTKAQAAWKRKYFCVPTVWWPQIDKALEKDRCLVTPYGREFAYYDFMSDSLKKEATSHVPQSTSVDYLNSGLLRVHRDLAHRGKCDLLHQQHDSILVQYKIEDRDEVCGEIKQHIESKLVVNGCTFSIPVEVKCGPNWLEMKEWKPAA